MPEIDVEKDLEAVTTKIAELVKEVQELDAKRQNLVQQAQNLNGVAMYLRGKQPPAEVPPPSTDEE